MRTIHKTLMTVMVLCGTMLYGQQNITQTTNNDEYYKPYLPNINPPSPDSFSITEYGKNGSNEFEGKPSLSIPLYQYTAGNITVPIQLSYSATGVKVNDVASWTGMNWVLSAGGVINRTVKDLPDEIAQSNFNRVFVDESNLLSSTTGDCSPNSQFYYNLAYITEEKDTEVDIFNFSAVGALSGSFYLDQNMSPVIINNDTCLKVEIPGNNLLADKQFLITDTNGVKYYFGGSSSEETGVISGSRAGLVLSTTSFYLYKIEDPKNGTILFDYDTLTDDGSESSRIYKLNKSYSQKFAMNSFSSSNTGESILSTMTKTIVTNPKHLKKIKSLNNGVEVVFSSTAFSNYNFLRRLDNITITNGTTVLKTVDFSYQAKMKTAGNFSSADRFFLSKVEFNKNLDASNVKHEVYKMEYDSLTYLPDRLSDAQDMKGYYNGEINNTHLIVKPLFSQVTGTYANRYPHFNFAKMGTLTKITYPTGGSTLFEYESNPAKEAIYTQYAGYAELTSSGQNLDNNQIPRYLPDTETMIFDAPVYKDQNINITLHTNASSEDTYNNYHMVRAKMVITNLTHTNIAPVTILKGLGYVEGSRTDSYLFHQGDKYKVEISFDNPSVYPSDPTQTIGAWFDFEIMEGYRDIDGLGLRLKKENNVVNGTNTQIKRYYYKSIDGSIQNPKIELKFAPAYEYIYDEQMTNAEGNWSSESRDNVLLHSEGISNYCSKPEEAKFYVVSTSYGGDNYENGGEEKFFSFEEDVAIVRIRPVINGCAWAGYHTIDGEWFEGVVCGVDPNRPKNTIDYVRDTAKSYEITDNSTYNGTLVSHRIYKKQNGNLFKSQQTDNEYTIAQNTKATSLVCRTLFGHEVVGIHCNADLSDPEKMPVSSCYLGYYTTKAMTRTLTKVTTKTFIDPVPLSVYYPAYVLFETTEIDIPALQALENTYKHITTQEQYQYGALKGLPTQITTTGSDGMESKTQNTYVNGASSLSGLSTSNIGGYAGLQSQNIVSSPIEVRRYKNNTLLSTQRTLYKDWNSLGMVVPEKIQTAKGNNTLEDRALFEEYDSKGNPTLVSYKDGMKTKYVYNSLNQVIAKLENFTGTLDSNTNSISNACTFIGQYPTAQVTVYTYDATTSLLMETMDSNCRKTTYVYDALHHLKQIKDHDGNVLKEFDSQYKPQN